MLRAGLRRLLPHNTNLARLHRGASRRKHFFDEAAATDYAKKQTAHLLSQMGGCIRRQASWGHHA
jgi:hypothetical protein